MDVGDIILLGFLLLTLIFEFVVLLKLFERKHKWSGVLFYILTIGFLQELFYASSWLKQIYGFTWLYAVRDDLNTVPMLCFVLSFSILSISISSIDERHSNIFLLIYGSYIFCSLMVILLVQTFLEPISRYTDSAAKHNSAANSGIICSGNDCGSFSYPYRNIVLEYLLIYLPVTGLLYYNTQPILAMINEEPRPVSSVCASCQLYESIIKYILGYFLVIMWIIQPVLLVGNVYGDIMRQNYIPSMSTMVVFLSVLCALVWNRKIFDHEDLRCSDQKFIDYQNSMSP